MKSNCTAENHMTREQKIRLLVDLIGQLPSTDQDDVIRTIKSLTIRKEIKNYEK